MSRKDAARFAFEIAKDLIQDTLESGGFVLNNWMDMQTRSDGCWRHYYRNKENIIVSWSPTLPELYVSYYDGQKRILRKSVRRMRDIEELVGISMEVANGSPKV